MSNYWRADTKTQWFQDDFPGADMNLKPENMVLVLHTTETTTFPSYSGGATAPNYTGLPPLGSRFGKWRAHFPDEKSSRALRNLPGGVETNTLNVVQVELIGTCDPKHRKSWNGEGQLLAGKHYVYWPEASLRQLRWLGRLIANLNKRHGLRLSAPKIFRPYPGSYGTNNGVRLTFDEWRKVTGVIGHMHVPENSHGDPGNINITYVLDFARKKRRL